VALDKKHQERIYFEVFREVYEDFPQGIACIQERPDFVIKDGANRIGLEITRYFRPTPKDQRPMQEQLSLQRQILQRAQSNFAHIDGRKLRVQVVFRIGIDINKSDIADTANGLTSVLSAIELNETLNRFISVTKPDLWPELVTSVHARLCIGREVSYWQPATAAWVRTLMAADIQDVILRKASSFGGYESELNETWLLIVADGVSFVDLSDAAKIYSYEGPFDRVIFLDMFSGTPTLFHTQRADVDTTTSQASPNKRCS
jgi:hypothetical protein